MRSRFAGYPSRRVMTSKLDSLGKRRQAKRRKPARRVARRKRRVRRTSRRTKPAGSRRRGSSTRRGSPPIGSPLVLVRLLVRIERADDLANQVMADDVPGGGGDEIDPPHVVQR